MSASTIHSLQSTASLFPHTECPAGVASARGPLLPMADSDQPPACMTVRGNSPAQPHDVSPIREVEIRERPEQFPGLAIVRLGRVDLTGEPSEVARPTVLLYRRCPLAPAFVPEHAFEAGGSAGLALVLVVLGLGTHAQIAPAVVPPVAVGVIDHLPHGWIHDEPVHKDIPPLDPGVRIAPSPTCPPVVLAEPRKVRRVDDNRPPLPQGNIAHSLPFRRPRRNLPPGTKLPAVHDDPRPRHVGQFSLVPRIIGAEQPFASSVPDAQGTSAL